MMAFSVIFMRSIEDKLEIAFFAFDRDGNSVIDRNELSLYVLFNA